MAQRETDADWRRRRRFNQGERIDGADAPAQRSLLPVVAGGAAMLATTAILGLLGAPGWLAAAGGIALFVFVLSATRPRPKTTRPGAREIDPDTMPSGLDRAEVEAALKAAAADLEAIGGAARTLDVNGADRTLAAALGGLTDAARDVLDAVAADPGDFRRARKYLKVYLPAARASVEKFTALGVVNDAALDDKFRALIDDMTTTSRRQKETLALDDKADLEVEMEVLAERLAREN